MIFRTSGSNVNRQFNCRIAPLVASRDRLGARQEFKILASGRALTDIETKLAVAVGVHDPARVRIKLVRQMPAPADPELRAIASQTGLIGPHTGGITMGHGIYLLNGQVSNRLVSHELRHVHQYEAAGSIASF